MLEAEGDGGGPTSFRQLLFDLLMVAAASALSDNLSKNLTWSGAHETCTLYFIVTSGWLLYSHNFRFRQVEPVSVHAFLLLPLLLGLAMQIVNSSFESAQLLAIGAVAQRFCFLLILLPAALALPRARYKCTAFGSISISGLAIYAVAPLLQPSWVPVLLSFACFWDVVLEAVVIVLIPGRKKMPIHMERSKDRLGMLALIMVGEAIISSTLSYRTYAADFDAHRSKHHYERQSVTELALQRRREYEGALALGFALVFLFSILIANVTPTNRTLPFRLPRVMGTVLLLLKRVLGLGSLAVGLGVKLSVRAFQEQTAYEPFNTKVLGTAVGSCMLLLLAIRVCHYGGEVPRPTDSALATVLIWLWWLASAVLTAIPFGLSLIAKTPFEALYYSTGVLVAACASEYCFTHYLYEKLGRVNRPTKPHNSTPKRSPFRSSDDRHHNSRHSSRVRRAWNGEDQEMYPLFSSHDMSVDSQNSNGTARSSITSYRSRPLPPHPLERTFGTYHLFGPPPEAQQYHTPPRIPPKRLPPQLPEDELDAMLREAREWRWMDPMPLPVVEDIPTYDVKIDPKTDPAVVNRLRSRKVPVYRKKSRAMGTLPQSDGDGLIKGVLVDPNKEPPKQARRLIPRRKTGKYR